MEDCNFKDTVVDTIVKRCRSKTIDDDEWFLVLTGVKYVYENLPKKSPLHKLFIAMFVNHASGDWLADGTVEMEDIPQGFLFDLAHAFLVKRQPLGPSFLLLYSPRCRYHCHGSGQDCYRQSLP